MCLINSYILAHYVFYLCEVQVGKSLFESSPIGSPGPLHVRWFVVGFLVLANCETSSCNTTLWYQPEKVLTKNDKNALLKQYPLIL